MAKLPIGRASVRIEAGWSLELDRIDTDGVKWVKPAELGVAVSDSAPRGDGLNEVVVRMHGNLPDRIIGIAIIGADAGEWVFVGTSMPPEGKAE